MSAEEKGDNLQAGKQYANLAKDIQNARLRASMQNYSAATLIGPVDVYDPKELVTIEAKVRASFGYLYLIECPTFVHDMSAALLGGGLRDELNRYVTNLGHRFNAVGSAGTFPRFVNKLECGAVVGKIADNSLIPGGRRIKKRANAPIVLEVAFRNEKFHQLLIEGANWVNEFTDVDIALLLQANENEARSNVTSFDLVVLKRIRPLWSDIAVKPEPFCIDWACASEDKARRASSSVLERQLEVSILYRRNISRESLRLGYRVVFSLPTAGLNEFCQPSQIFAEQGIEIDLTETMKGIFEQIDMLVEFKTYPNLA